MYTPSSQNIGISRGRYMYVKILDNKNANLDVLHTCDISNGYEFVLCTIYIFESLKDI